MVYSFLTRKPVLCCNTSFRLALGRLLSPRQNENITGFRGISLSHNLASSGGGLKPDEDFWKKNQRLQRPMSPHVTIYRFPLPAVMSITHRATGLILSTTLYGFSVGMLLLPGNFTYYYSLLQFMHYGAGCVFIAKFALAWPFMYHFANGMRHLVWDMGKGLQMKDVYTSGWTVIALSTTLALIAAAIKF